MNTNRCTPQTRNWLLAALGVGLLLLRPAHAEPNWPQWRGPHQNGHTAEKNIPFKWGAEDVAWKTELPGQGHSTPILHGERLFLTAALEGGKQRDVSCYDRGGKLVWRKSIEFDGEVEKLHGMNSYATPTCATDGEIVVAFFGRAGIHCYSVEGEHRWSKGLGGFLQPWGVAACPIVVGDVVIQNCDADEDSYLIALNKNTGETVWKTPRPNFRGWSTPVVVEANGHRELVLNGHTGARGYDPQSGKELWSVNAARGRGTPTVTPGADGLLFVICGLAADMYAVKAGGKGDVTGSHREWTAPRTGGRDLPSPIVIGGRVLAMSMSGVLTCYETETGDEIWTARIPNQKFSASPIAAAGKAYFIAESGETFVIDPGGDDAKIVARNKLPCSKDEIFRATPTPSQAQLFIRSDRVLYCVGKRRAKE